LNVGVGTERIEEDLQKLFPQARIARADRDNINSRESLDELISQIENKEVDIIVGTQMIAKGLDFEALTLVGVVLADIGFNLPDFRSAERSFQLLMQVSGRSGRHLAEGRSAGEVVIQTFNPQHTSILYAQNHDYKGFAEQELSLRQELFYPPYGRLVSIRVQGNSLGAVQSAARQIIKRGEALQKTHSAFIALEALGPAEMPIAKLRGQHRYHVLIKGQNHAVLAPFCQKLSDFKVPGVKISVDVDPLHML
jgi:primosomal protein N' (replication factor Y)